MTFSVAARCKETGMFGTIVTSSSICVASRCAFSRANVGACMTQNITNPDLGPHSLDLMEQGHGIDTVMELTKQAEPHIEWRQLGMINARGETAVFSGSQTLGIHATAGGDNCVAQGNMLANEAVPQAMINSFEASTGHLAERLLHLDEATSALDAETEAKLHIALADFLKGRTMIIVAHRLSAVKQADTVYVFEDGKITEQGGHEELINSNGLYAKLYGQHQNA